MAKEKKVGLYLGVNSVGATVIQGNDILSLGRFEFSSLEEAGGEVRNEDIRWEALINKTLREVSNDAKNIYVSLADRDFIFRLLEMPSMSKKEIELSLVYEIEKYIPFKVEELVWDYEYAKFPKERKIGLSFIGIKEGNFQRIKSILSRLELKAATIEPSCVSLARVLKSVKKFDQFNNFALLDFTQAEAYLTFFQKDLPVFNRYLVVPKKEDALDLNNFIEAVNFSFLYFKREFKNYKLDKFIIVGDSNVDSLVLLLKEGLQIEMESVSPYDLTNHNNAQVENVKALGATGLERSLYKFKPYLRKTEERLAPSGGFLTSATLKVGLLSSLVGIGLIGTIFLSLILGNNLAEKKFVLNKIEEDIAKLNALDEFTLQERATMVSKEEEQIRSLKNMLASLFRISPFFDRIATGDMFPGSLWLSELDINRQTEKYRAVVGGYIFRDNDYEEKLGVDEFISNLREDKIVGSIFSKVELNSSNRHTMGDFQVTRFSIILNE